MFLREGLCDIGGGLIVIYWSSTDKDLFEAATRERVFGRSTETPLENPFLSGLLVIMENELVLSCDSVEELGSSPAFSSLVLTSGYPPWGELVRQGSSLDDSAFLSTNFVHREDIMVLKLLLLLMCCCCCCCCFCCCGCCCCGCCCYCFCCGCGGETLLSHHLVVFSTCGCFSAHHDWRYDPKMNM